MMEFSVSSMKQFKACRRAYELRKIYNVYPIQTADSLQIGLTYHSMLEDMRQTGELPELNSKEAAMVHAYKKYIDPQMPQFEPEVWISKPIGRDRLVGRADGIAMSEKAIIEHKTTSLSTEEYEYNLEWDEQLLAYFMVTGCRLAYYTVCRKPTIRQKQSETDEEFAKRCLAWYDEDTQSKIRMFIVRRTDEQVAAYKKELRRMISEIKRATKSGNFYRNTCNCNAWGRDCEYKQICLNYDPNETYVGFERRERYANNENNG